MLAGGACWPHGGERERIAGKKTNFGVVSEGGRKEGRGRGNHRYFFNYLGDKVGAASRDVCSLGADDESAGFIANSERAGALVRIR